MKIEKLATVCINAIKNGSKIICIGNGGSATMASHFVGELQGKYKYDRKSLPAITLFDLASMTAISNDMGYENVFVRPLSALGKPGDVLIGLSTSGKSKNVNLALDWAKKNGLTTCDFERVGNSTPEIQENQLVALHELAEKIENYFVNNK